MKEHYTVIIKLNNSIFPLKLKCTGDGTVEDFGIRWFITASEEAIEIPIRNIQFIKFSKERLKFHVEAKKD